MTTPTDDLTQRARDALKWWEELQLAGVEDNPREFRRFCYTAEDLLCALIEERERLRDAGERALSLDRQPHPPSGGMQTGDMIVVGMRDWFGLLRLARMCAALTPKEPTDG